MVEFSGKTHIGRRKLNEDRFLADGRLGIALVSDGMGGPEAGEVAAEIVSESILIALGEGRSLQEAVVAAHDAVQSAPESGRGKRGMGATLVIAKFAGHDFELAWIGDSRAYLWDGQLRLLTRDHSKVENLLASGAISLDEAAAHRERNLITRAMGLNQLSTAEVPVLRGTLCRNQQLLLCSDGLNDALSGSKIFELMSSDTDVEAKLGELIDQALQAGGADNITAVIVSPGDQAPDSETRPVIPAVSLVHRDGSSHYFKPDDRWSRKHR